MSGVPPAVLAHIDQQRAKTNAAVSELVGKFRTHAEVEHAGDPTCAHAMCIMELLNTRCRIEIADLAGSAVARIVALEDELRRARR